MVFGITLRRRKTVDEPTEQYKPSPSLPVLSSSDLDWPENLIDTTISFEDDSRTPNTGSIVTQSPPSAFHAPRARKASVSSSPPGGKIPSFHKPFRPSQSVEHDATSADGKQSPPLGRISIASMYASPTPGANFFTRSSSVAAVSPSTSIPGSRRLVRVPPRLNIMVAGALGSGKTSFLKLFLNTCDISPTASELDNAEVRRFLTTSIKHTKASKTVVSVEVCEDRHERVQLSLIDTVGFDFEEGKELELQLGVSSLMKYLDQQFAESMLEESKVVRKNKGDQHIHLCLYLINPDSIMTTAQRREKASNRYPSKTSQVTLNRRGSLSSITSQETSEDTSSDEEEDEEDAHTTVNGHTEPKKAHHRKLSPNVRGLTMCPAELRVMKRLATRCNVLPIIGHADTLTEERLTLVKEVVKSEVTAAGIGFSVFDTSYDSESNGNGNGVTSKKQRHRRRKSNTLDTEDTPPLPPLPANIGSPQTNSLNATSGEDTDDDRPARPVIKLRSPRNVITRDRSRSRRRMLTAAEEDDGSQVVTVPAMDDDGPPSPSAWPSLPKVQLAQMLPFTVVAPEEAPPVRKPRQRRRTKDTKPKNHPPEPSEVSTADTAVSTSATDTDATTEATSTHDETSQQAQVPVDVITTPRSTAATPTVRRRPSMKDYKVRIRTPNDFKGKYVRKYRWGTIDALDPAHCDFVALRTAVLGTHMRALRNTTREVLYEKFRTEKLLARRATQNFNEAEREKMLQVL